MPHYRRRSNKETNNLIVNTPISLTVAIAVAALSGANATNAQSSMTGASAGKTTKEMTISSRAPTLLSLKKESY